jgi:hypothetical protein
MNRYPAGPLVRRRAGVPRHNGRVMITLPLVRQESQYGPGANTEKSAMCTFRSQRYTMLSQESKFVCLLVFLSERWGELMRGILAFLSERWISGPALVAHRFTRSSIRAC